MKALVHQDRVETGGIERQRFGRPADGHHSRDAVESRCGVEIAVNGQDISPVRGDDSAMGDGWAQHDNSTTWIHASGSQPFEYAAGEMRCRGDCHGPDCRGGIAVVGVVHRGSSASWRGFPQI